MDRGPYVLTRSGKRFYLLDPRPEDVCIEDIASALAKQCRYNGHCEGFYSVAEHSVLVSLLAPPRLALEALLHDAAEAYIGDIVAPLKRAMGRAMGFQFAFIEQRIMRVIGTGLGVRGLEHRADRAEVKAADLVAGATEARALMGVDDPAGTDGWPSCEPSDAVEILRLDPGEARVAFLARYHELTGAMGESPASVVRCAACAERTRAEQEAAEAWEAVFGVPLPCWGRAMVTAGALDTSETTRAAG